MSPLVDVCNRLMRYDISLIPEDTRPYFRDVYDHVVRMNEMIDNLRELLTTALEANLSLISVAQTEHTKRLAAWAAIIAVPTMIAGVYGMNFDAMPELHWQVRLSGDHGDDARRLRGALHRLSAVGMAVREPTRESLKSDV